MNEDQVLNAFRREFSSTEPKAEIMWMPGGTHRITCGSSKGLVTKTVTVDKSTAIAAQKSLDGYLTASRNRPYLDFNHEMDEASAWVNGFTWRETPEPGVYAQVEWSAAGADAIRGRSYRGFSPSFTVDANDPARVTGAPLCMGGLVNDPAFKQMAPLWARNAATMEDKDKQTTAAAQGAAANRTADGPVTVEVLDASNALKAKDRELETARAETETLKAKLAERSKADAQAAVQAAIERGALAPKDTTLHAKWQAAIEADPNAKAMLDAIPAAAVLQAGRITSTPGAGRVEITSEDTRRVIKAYADEQDPRLRGAIYARDISSRIAKKDELVLIAANSLGSLVGDIISQRTLELLKFEFPVLGRISTDLTDENADFGQSVKVRLVTPPAASDYVAGTGYSIGNAVTTDVAVTINAHKAVTVEFNANELSGTRRQLFGEQDEGLHYSLGKVIVDAVYALIIGGAGNFTNSTIQALATFTKKDVTAMAKELGKRGVPRMNRTLLLNSDYFEALGNDSAIVSLAAYQRPEVITDYVLPKIAGFQPYEAPNLPTTGNLTGFGFTPSALALATRVPNDYATALPGVTGGGISKVITNPDTGISVMQTQFVDHRAGSAVQRIAIMYGVARGQVAAGQILKSA